jgi:hypothetical protein
VQKISRQRKKIIISYKPERVTVQYRLLHTRERGKLATRQRKYIRERERERERDIERDK